MGLGAGLWVAVVWSAYGQLADPCIGPVGLDRVAGLGATAEWQGGSWGGARLRVCLVIAWGVGRREGRTGGPFHSPGLPRRTASCTALARARANLPRVAPCARPPPPPHREYASFRVSSEGELQGVGMLIANEPVNGHLLVLAPIKGGPADRAGVLPGDELTSINGMSMEVGRYVC